MSIKENDRVRVIKAEGELSPLVGAIGEVVRIYELGAGDIAAVRIIPDEPIAREIIVKLPVENLEKVTAQTQETEIPEGAKQISKADFEAALAEITSPEKMLSRNSNPMVGLTRIMAAHVVGDAMKNELFKDQDVIVVTEGEFIVALWNACNPVSVNGMIDNKMSVRKIVDVSLTAILTLQEIVPILFGGSDD
jgi:hypothetical protein